MPIYFYSPRERYGCLSNFSPHGFELGGRWWPTSEHYFQAQKFAGTPREELIRRARTPREAAELGRSRAHPLRHDWERARDEVMRAALRAKFTRHADIRAVLLDTGDEPIVERAPHDYYWGIGADGSGKNMLGRLLVELRAALRAG